MTPMSTTPATMPRLVIFFMFILYYSIRNSASSAAQRVASPYTHSRAIGFPDWAKAVAYPKLINELLTEATNHADDPLSGAMFNPCSMSTDAFRTTP
jgi:hypothetical protein